MQLQTIQNSIYEVRGQKVMLDFDLAEMYEVLTKNLNLAVKRNIKRFPQDFMFQLTKSEWDSLRLQIETSKGRGGTRYLPYAFTEQGLAMLSGILNSDKAIEVNIAIMRAFVMLRQYALTYKEFGEKLATIESKFDKHDKQFEDVYEAINLLMQNKEEIIKHEERERIGFKK